MNVKKTIKKAAAAALALGLGVSLAGCTPQKADISSFFSSDGTVAYCTGYKELSANKTNSTEAWRNGMVCGNGRQGAVVSGSPYEDTLIFQNIHFIMPNNNPRTCPDTSDELENVKQSIVKGEDITDDASYDDVYYYHPGGQLRISSEKSSLDSYIRYTDYNTAQTGVKYTDKNGTWERATFTSKADDVTVTMITKSDAGTKINTTLSFDNISCLANYGDGNEKDMQYKKTAGESGEYIAFVAHYPNYENSELKYGGYATLTFVVCEGGTKEAIQGNEVKDEQYVSEENPQIQINDADAVYLITVSDRDSDMGKIDDFKNQTEYELLDDLKDKAQNVAEKYTENGAFNYQKALGSHLEIYQPQFEAVTFELGDGSSDKSNEELIKDAKGSDEISAPLAQRAYYSGRYAYICCAGYSTSRLYGMWTGEWNTGWGSKYTMDANVNLQVSSMNTSNISSAPIGYAYFILRQLPDWEENAKATHGYTDAIQAPVNTDGDCAAITETCYPYPFRYWNAGTAWMILPLYETLQCYGDIQIPLSDEFDLEELKSVLSPVQEDLTDEDIEKIEERGYLELEKDILLPLLTKSANYWDQLLSPEYYTDAQGAIHYEKGKTQLEEGESYCILPSYSPENNPANYSSPSTANCAIDISACRSSMDMLIRVIKDVDPDADTSKWEQLKNDLPPYLYDETGALKEWACTDFTENNEHRHLSHMYCVWPLNETQDDEELKKACEQAIANRESENEASHALVHRSLIDTRLKNRSDLTQSLATLMNSKIYYDSLMTNHNFDRDSCYCTDFELGYLGIINEALVYSEEGEIELLPCLPESGFGSGKITGLNTRTRAQIESLEWDIEGKTAKAVIKSDIEQTIEFSCGLSEDVKTATFKAGESKIIEFKISE